MAHANIHSIDPMQRDKTKWIIPSRDTSDNAFFHDNHSQARDDFFSRTNSSAEVLFDALAASGRENGLLIQSEVKNPIQISPLQRPSISKYRLYLNRFREMRFRSPSRTMYLDASNTRSVASRLRDQPKNGAQSSSQDVYYTHVTPNARTKRQSLNSNLSNHSGASVSTHANQSLKIIYYKTALTQTYLQSHSVPHAHTFCTNAIQTYRYNIFSFPFLFLFHSFRKPVNFYFLVSGFLQMIPSISPTEGIPLQFIPLSLVLGVDAVLAAYEDYRRHQADRAINSASATVYNRDLRCFEIVPWRDIRVGDIIQLIHHDTVPADTLILSVQRLDDTNQGVCYVETKSLDGETNLKLRQPLKNLPKWIHENDVLPMDFVFQSELPNNDVHQFFGTLQFGTEERTATIDNVLLRGSKIRSNTCVYGIVINTGADCKILQNACQSIRPKVSSIELVTDRQMLALVVMLIVMSLIGASGNTLYWKDMEDAWPFAWDPDSFLSTFMLFLIILASFVPITLYVAVTLVRATQSYFMENDLDMYDAASDTRMIVRKMTLNEQLGEISHIFTDKTGTLTCNIMEFRKCSINGVVYGTDGTHGVDETDETHAIDGTQGTNGTYVSNGTNGTNGTSATNGTQMGRKEYFNGQECLTVSHVQFSDEKLWRELNSSPISPQAERIHFFLLHLSLCHTVLIDHESEERFGTQYSAASPDEQALVSMARHCGYEFIHRDSNRVQIGLVDGSIETYFVLEIFAFDSDRKRMSVVVQKASPEGKVHVLCKGADTAVLSRLAANEYNARVRKKTESDIKSFAKNGLRILCLGVKELEIEDWEAFHAKYRKAKIDLEILGGRNERLETTISTLQNEMEQELFLIGATAIEDRLQDQVPETILKLNQAGISLCVLTGDMEETAMNIGYACNFLQKDMETHIINIRRFPSRGAILRELDSIFHAMYDSQKQVSLSEQSSDTTFFSTESGAVCVKKHALIIEGACLSLILCDSVWNLHLLRVMLLCTSVIACRVSPQQKAELVELVKLNVKNARTLAIGDGANDVPMIQTAHVGVGISGLEGLQAANSSDFSIAQFRFLKPLLLVHGRWNYTRISDLIVYTMYTNVVYCFLLFLYGLWLSGYSGQMMYSALLQQGYNIIFTCLPVLLHSIFDQDISRECVYKYPALYNLQVRQRNLFTFLYVWKWILYAVLDAGILFGITFAIGNTVEPYGETVTFTHLQSIGWILLCVTMNARFLIMKNTYNWMECLAMVLTILSIYAVSYFVDIIQWTSPDYDTLSYPWMFYRPTFWLGQIFAIVAVCAKDYLFSAYAQCFYPALVDLVRELKNGKGVEVAERKLENFDSRKVFVESEWRTGIQIRSNQYLSRDLIHMIDHTDRRNQNQVSGLSEMNV